LVARHGCTTPFESVFKRVSMKSGAQRLELNAPESAIQPMLVEGDIASAYLSVPPDFGVTVVVVAAAVVVVVAAAVVVVLAAVVVVVVAIVVFDVCGAADVVDLLELQLTKTTPSNKITDMKAKRSFLTLFFLSFI
jgi:hypothetical protein